MKKIISVLFLPFFSVSTVCIAQDLDIKCYPQEVAVSVAKQRLEGAKHNLLVKTEIKDKAAENSVKRKEELNSSTEKLKLEKADKEEQLEALLADTELTEKKKSKAASKLKKAIYKADLKVNKNVAKLKALEVRLAKLVGGHEKRILSATEAVTKLTEALAEEEKKLSECRNPPPPQA